MALLLRLEIKGILRFAGLYSTASASETSILRSGIDKSVDKSSLSLSPQQIGYARHNRGSDPLNNTTGEITSSSGNWSYAGGGTKYAAALLSTGVGLLNPIRRIM